VLVKPPPCNQFPGYDARGPYVAAAVDVVPSRLLGRHVADLPLDQPRVRSNDSVRRLRHAEVGELRRAVDAAEDVLRRKVAVHEPERVSRLVLELVGRVESFERVEENSRHEWKRNLLAAALHLAHEAGKAVPFDVVENEVDAERVVADFENGD